MFDVRLDQDESGKQDHAQCEVRQDDGRCPAQRLAFVDCQHQEREACCEQRNAEVVDLFLALGLLGRRQAVQCGEGTEDADRDVDIEDRAPADRRNQETADEGADRHGDRLYGTLDADGPPPLTGREGLRDQRHRIGLQEARADGLQNACTDEEPG